MNDIILSLVIFTILVLAAYPIFKSRDRGIKCLGCANAKQKSCSCDDDFFSRHKSTWVDQYREDKKRQNI